MNKSEKDYGMIDWWKVAFIQKYADFNGRARRSEFWYFILVNFLMFLVLYIPIIISIVTESAILSVIFGVLISLYALAIFIPSIAVAVRRLHDSNNSGWLYLLNLVPLGGLILLYFYIIEGTKGRNNYGEDPKNPENEINEIGGF